MSARTQNNASDVLFIYLLKTYSKFFIQLIIFFSKHILSSPVKRYIMYMHFREGQAPIPV